MLQAAKALACRYGSAAAQPPVVIGGWNERANHLYCGREADAQAALRIRSGQ
jgi:hypothetical protein